MGKIIKKVLKVLMWIILSLIVLMTALFFLIQQNFVQTFLAHKAAGYLSRQLESNVYIEKLKIVFPFNVDIENLGIDDRHGQPILQTRHMQFSLSSLAQKAQSIKVGRIALEDTRINMVKYAGDSVMNFQFIIDYFSGQTDTSDSVATPLTFNLLNASIANASFTYHNHNREPKPSGIDYNHLQLDNIHLTVSKLSYSNDTLKALIHHLSANESCGFVLNRLSAGLSLTPEGIFTENLIIQTPKSDLLLNVAFLFNNYSSFSEFTNSIYLQADIFPSEFDISDLAFFVSDIKGMDSKYTIEGQVRGEVKSLSLKNFAINYGSYTTFKGNITLDGLPDIKETFIHINARELSTHYRDLLSLKLPSENGVVFIKLPEEFIQLGHVKVKGRFTGFYNDFVSDGTFRTSQGTLTTDIMLKYNFDTRQIAYSGELKTRRFNIGKLIEQEQWIGRVNLNATVDGKGQLPSSFDVKFAASIDSIDFRGNNLNSLVVSGELTDKQFNGTLKLNDELINLDFLGLFDLNSDPPVFNFSAQLNNACLARLNLIERDSTSMLSTNMEINFSGNNPDNLHGEILINNTRYHESGQDYNMDVFSLNAHPVNNGNRKLTLRSDYIDADFDGNFNYSQIYPAFLKILYIYLPSAEEERTRAVAEIPEQSFTSIITLKNTQPFSKLFLPEVVINKDARIETHFNSLEGIVGVSANASDLSLYGTRLKNWHFNLGARNEDLNVQTGADHFLIKEANDDDALEPGLEKILVAAEFSGDTIAYNISWDNQSLSEAYSGDLTGFFTFLSNTKSELRITESNLAISGIPWQFNNDNKIIIDTSSITVNNLIFESKGQKIMANGIISHDPVEKLTIGFEQWNLSGLDEVLQSLDAEIGGALNGHVDLMGIYNNPSFLAEISVDDFYLNKEQLGNLHLNTSYDSYTQSVWVDSEIKYTGNAGTITPFSLKGFYYPQSETENFDAKMELLNFKLAIFEPFLKGILSEIKGLASGNVFIKGRTTSPELNGEISLMRTEFKVDFTNTKYSLADLVHIETERIWANKLSVSDQYGNTALADLEFSHKNFSDWKMDLRLQANNLAGLQTTASDNNLFYGTAYATGSFSLAGAFNDLLMDIKVRSGPQTYIAIPISFAVDVSDTDFIIFMNPETETQNLVVEEKDPSSFRVNMEMDITRDAEIQIFLPYQMGNIRSNGSGNMKMYYNTTGDFTMYGDYITNQGLFLFTLQNMINRTFTLIPGGTIRWSGNPYDADINIQAIYKTRVALNSLPNISDEYKGRRFPVDCILTLKNSLMNPEIRFGIRMPNVDEEIQQQVFSAVDTTNEVIMNRQMISLLVLNNFNFSTDQTNLASTLEASSFELLSNQLNNWLSQISKDFDIGVNYRPGDQLSSEELELALSTQLFDDRVIIDGNLGMIGEHDTQQNASNIIGDINVEIKITRDGRFRVKAFNKYNDQEITRREAPYTQGIGVFYRREFDKFSDLWKPRKKILIEQYLPNGNGADSTNSNTHKQ